jgi:hypothetical protein
MIMRTGKHKVLHLVKREPRLEDVGEVGRSTHVSDVKCVWAFVLKTAYNT